MRATAEDRFWAKVSNDHDGSCWLWTAATNHGGYGLFRAERVLHQAHRWAYEQLVGAIPEGLQLDHLCRVRRCVNPAHLEPVTQHENMERGYAARGLKPKRSQDAGRIPKRLRTECPAGHPYDAENTYRHRRADGRLRRGCRKCVRVADSRYQARKRTAKQP